MYSVNWFCIFNSKHSLCQIIQAERLSVFVFEHISTFI